MCTMIIPYELVERLFGTFIAKNFNTIVSIITVIGIIFTIRSGRIKFRNEDSWLNKAQKKQNKRFDYMNEAILNKDENKVWDSEKGRWIDKEEEARKERYRKYHEDKPPTFEEWKAQREKEQQEQQK